MNSKFICVYTEEDKKELLSLGYKLFKEENIGNEKAYVFFNDVEKMDFLKRDGGKYLFTNKLTF